MTLPETDLNHPAPAPLWLPALVTGFGTAVAMWTVWWITHLPTGQDFAPPWNVSLPLLALVLVGGVVLGSRHAAKPILSGTIAGLVTAALALIVLGAVLSDTEGETASAEAARSFRDDAPVIVLGFLAASAVAGALGGLMGLALRARGHSTESRWVGRMAIVAACSFLPLIAIGGAVTSTASGMAVTEPVVSFVMPLKLMAEPRVFIEHTHRLVGSLVGLTAIALLVTTLLTTTRPSGRVIAGVLLALVATQGTLGIFRVGENSSVLAMFHGMFAQLVFATGVAAAAWLSPRFADPEPSRPAACDRAAQKAYPLAVAALALYAFQLATGAASRHFGAQHATLTHVGFSIIVASVVAMVGTILASGERSSDAGRRLTLVGKGLLTVVTIQFMLGMVTVYSVSGRDRTIPTQDQLATAAPIEGVNAVIATAHQTTGALLLALIVLATLWTWRLKPAKADSEALQPAIAA